MVEFSLASIVRHFCFGNTLTSLISWIIVYTKRSFEAITEVLCRNELQRLRQASRRG